MQRNLRESFSYAIRREIHEEIDRVYATELENHIRDSLASYSTTSVLDSDFYIVSSGVRIGRKTVERRKEKYFAYYFDYPRDLKERVGIEVNGANVQLYTTGGLNEVPTYLRAVHGREILKLTDLVPHPVFKKPIEPPVEV